jgi:hypothetical protein
MAPEPKGIQRSWISDAAERLWVCEKGHVDDHHLADPNPEQRCSRCGGRCREFTLDGLASEQQEAWHLLNDECQRSRYLDEQLQGLKEGLEAEATRVRGVAEVHRLGHLEGRARDLTKASELAQIYGPIADRLEAILDTYSVDEGSGR